MLGQLTLTELVIAGVLCVFALSTARASDLPSTAGEDECSLELAPAVAFAAARDACESGQGNDRAAALKRDAAEHTKASAEA